MHPHEGVANEHYKLIHFWCLGGCDLYELAVDPAEMKILADDPAYSGVAAELKDELARLHAEYDIGPEKDDYFVKTPTD